MSSQWNDASAAIQTRNNMVDSNYNQTSFDPSQFQNPQNLQRMQNGAYQTNPVVPAKRQREGGDSPSQSQGMLPGSRSQTPQQAVYSGFQPNNNLSQTPSQPYNHLNGSTNTPSPVLSNQLRPGSIPQRVATASPHPFSPAAQQFSAQGSPPPHSDHGSRVNTPQNSQFMQNGAYQPGPVYSGPPSSISAPHMQQQPGQPSLQFQHNSQSSQSQAQQQANAKMAYQMRLQQSVAQGNMLAAQRGAQNMGQVPNNMQKPPQMPPMNGQFSQGARPQQSPQQNPSRAQNPEVFMKKLIGFMQSNNRPLDLAPVVGDRQINLVMLYMAVSNFGGYKKVCQMNGWHQVSQALKIPLSTAPNAPQELKIHYEKNLQAFEEAWTGIQQRQAQYMRQNPMVHPPMSQVHPSQMSPTKQMGFPGGMQQSPQYMQHLQQQNVAQQQLQQQQVMNTPMKQMQSGQSLPAINGFSTPQGTQAQINNNGHVRNSLSRSMDPSPTQNGTGFTVPSPSARKESSVSGMLSTKLEKATKSKSSNANVPKDLASEYEPWLRPLTDSWGGHPIAAYCQLGEEISLDKPNVPTWYEMGSVDIQALNLSLQSRLHAEVRHALDTLATLSNEHRIAIDLRYCDDLVDSLVDCAEEQVELLAEHSDEIYDLDITSYEDVVRGCHHEQDALQEVPAYGSQEYELDRAVDRLICITTIMRNFSFVEFNLKLLADQVVVRFLSTAIRYLGTRHMLLRKHSNTLDFMKDVIVLLSNIAQDIVLPGKDQATHLLLFVLAFAPSPPPDITSPKPMFFIPYDPSIHKYLPPAVDCLAKLLARDEPNRTFYRNILTSDGHHPNTTFDILTKTFALAISPVPEYHRKSLLATVELRKPFLMQGMLAAEILVNLAPGFETGVARAWLASQDGFAHSLMRLVEFLCREAALQTQTEAHHEAQMAQQRMAHNQRGRGPPPYESMINPLERGSLAVIAQRAVRILKRLVEKCLDPADMESVRGVPVGVWPKQESLLGALGLRDIDPVVLAGLLGLARLEDGVVR